MRIFNRQTGINTPRRDATAAKASLPLFAGEGFAQILGMVGKSGFDFGPVVDGKFACLIKRLAAGEFFAMPGGRCDVVCFHVGSNKTKARIAPRLRQESFPRADDSSSRLCHYSLYHNRPLRRKGVK